MPLLLQSEANRRAFLHAVSTALLCKISDAAPNSKWALLSDTHIPSDRGEQYRGFQPVNNLEKVITGVRAFAPTGAIIGGDLAREEGLRGDYTNLSNLLESLEPGITIGLALGNHDDRKNFLDAFAARIRGTRAPVEQKHVLVIEDPSIRLVLLDSLAFPHQVPGLLGRRQRTWLDQYLDSSGPGPVALFVHHTLNDEDTSLLDFEPFLAIASRHRCVKAIFYGHSHAYKTGEMDGVHLVNVPAVGYNFQDSEPVGWLQALFTAGGVDLTLEAIGGNRAEHGRTRSLKWRTG